MTVEHAMAMFKAGKATDEMAEVLEAAAMAALPTSRRCIVCQRDLRNDEKGCPSCWGYKVPA